VFYWIRTHTKDKYHILNLKEAEPENKEGYKWGWIDRTNALPLAAFLVLRKLVEEERPWNCSERIKKLEEEGDENGELTALREQQKDYEEIMSLYNWWVKDRFEENEQFEKNLNDCYNTWKKDPTEENKQKWFDAEGARNKREEEQLIRLVKIRNCLWT
jgi:GTPase SAR1 family protein